MVNFLYTGGTAHAESSDDLDAAQSIPPRLLRLHGLMHSRFPKMRQHLARRCLASFEPQRQHDRRLQDPTRLVHGGTMQVPVGPRGDSEIIQEPISM
jgi:hypothetical protein